MAFSTVLTLIVTPCALMLWANVRSWRERRRAKADFQAPPTPAYGSAVE